MSTFGRLALQLADDGWQPIPVRPRQKRPAVWRWQERRPPSILRRWAVRFPDYGIGLVCGGASRIVAVDIDVTIPEAADRLYSLAVAHLGPTPLMRVGRWPKLILVYGLSEPMPTERRTLRVGKLELLSEGAFFVACGIHPETGQPYSWPGDSRPEFTRPSTLQRVTPLQLKHFLDEAFRLFPVVQISEPAMRLPRVDKGGRAGGSPIVRCPRSGKVVDGRDAFLAQIVWRNALGLEYPTSEEVADVSWRDFAADADLVRPARNGRRSWAPKDALAKARTALSKVKAGAVQRVRRSRGRMASPEGADLPASELEAARAHLLSLYQRGRLRRSAWLIGDLMLRRLRNGTCVDSVGFLAKEAREAPRTVERARRKLLEMGLFGTGRQLGNRETTAPYFPTTEFVAKSLAGQVLSGGGVTPLTSIYQGEGPPSQTVAPVPAASPVPEPIAPPPPEIPPQAPDARQFAMFPPAVSDPELKAALSSWMDGPMPLILRLAYTEKKRRIGLRECDIARAVGISREHVANSRFETFGLSIEAAARVKAWLMPTEFPLPPDLMPISEKPARPHHRRGGKRPPDPGPVFPTLRLFSVIEGGVEADGEHRDQSRRDAA